MIVFAIFLLDTAVSGFSNDGVHYDDYNFTLQQYDKVFSSYSECEDYVNKTLSERKSRNIENSRFVILPIYCNDDDTYFKGK